MKYVSNILALALVLAVLAACVLGIYYAVGFVVDRFVGLDKTVATVTLVAVIALLLAARMISRGPRQAKQWEGEQQRRQQKADTYLQLIEIWAGVLRGTTSAYDTGPPQSDLQSAEGQFLVRASAGVIQQYVTFRSGFLAHMPQAPAFFGAMLLEMRKDLGGSNIGLHEGTLLELLRIQAGDDPQDSQPNEQVGQ